MQYEFIRAGLFLGEQLYAEKTVLVKGEPITYNPTRAVNPERRARRRVCAAFGVSSGRQVRKLRKAIRRGEV